MLADDGLRRRLAQTALAEAREIYSWPAIAARIEEVYNSLAGAAPDTSWGLDRAVEPCRFREAPHLL